MVAYCFVVSFFFSLKRVQKQKQKASQTQIYNKKRHKIKENCFFWTWVPSFPLLQKKTAAIVYGPLLFSLSLLETSVCSLSLHFGVFLCRGAGWTGVGEEKGNVDEIRPLWFEEQDPDLSSHHMTRKKDRGKEEDTYKKNVGFGSWCSNPPIFYCRPFSSGRPLYRAVARHQSIIPL